MTASCDSTPLKICTVCKKHMPPTEEFFSLRKQGKPGLKSQCKGCAAAYAKKHNAANSEIRSAQKKAYRAANKERLLIAKREWASKNRSKVSDGHAAYVARRSAKDPVFAMKRRVSSRIYAALKAGGYTKDAASHEILGCDWDDFKTHIERQFTNGMSWGNRGAWELDHIVPLATAKTEACVLALNHFTNLRPLWGELNRAKSDTVTHLI